MRDRVVHRLLYDYLVTLYDKTFIFDAWSCRKGKGLHEAVARAASFMGKYHDAWLWRADIEKFFDSVDQTVLRELLQRRPTDPRAIWLLNDIISSYSKKHPGRGMPIGNLTSQIFANIYLHELDRYMAHSLKPLGYLRYGDDWLCFGRSRAELELIRRGAAVFLSEKLGLRLSPKVDIIQPVHRGVTFLGIDSWPNGQRITPQTGNRIVQKLTPANYSSYEALVRQFSNKRSLKNFYWRTLDR